MSAFFHKLAIVFTDKGLRNRILFILGAIAVFRLLAIIPIPGVDQFRLAQFFADNQFLGLLNIFSGGGLAQLSIVMLGVGPYITASIVMQLSTIVFPAIKTMYSEEGDAGRAKFTEWTRVLAIPFSILQAVAFLSLLESQAVIAFAGSFEFAVSAIMVAAGSLLLMWIGELITEFGIGNGVSLIIFAGIVAGLPAALSQAVFASSAADLPAYLGFLAIALAIMYSVVKVAEAERSIPIAYARQVRGAAVAGGAATYLPIRLLQAGVIPIIFALSLLLVPQMALQALSAVGVSAATTWSAWYAAFSANHVTYGIVYFILVVLFTYFYTQITFEPKRVADNLQKSGAFVPGVRPGSETEKYIGAVVNRITLPGALFLGFVAVVPFIVQGVTGVSTIVVGGTALLIAVQVVLDLVRKIDAQISLREY